MPESTPNLGLKKPLGNETVSRSAYNENLDIIDQNAAKTSDFAAHLAETVIQTASGTANEITIMTGGYFSYTNGNYLKFKAVANNTGNVTINIDSKGVKALKKLDGSQLAAGGIKNGKVYEIYYDAVGDCFFLLARAEGNAVAGDVLADKIFSNGDDTGITGTMPNQGQKILTPGTASIAIPAGFHNGTGYVVGDVDLISANIKSGKNIFGVAGNVNVIDTSPGTAIAADILASKIAFVDGAQITGTMVDRGTVNITPSTANQTILGGKHSGSGVVYGDADLIPSNIIAGKNIFNVVGTAGGDKAILIGTVMIESMTLSYDLIGGSTWSGRVSNLSNYMDLEVETDYTYGDAVASTVNPINLTPFSKLWYNFATADRTALVGVGTSRTDTSMTVSASLSGSSAYASSSYLDITALSGLYYIKVRAAGTSGIAGYYSAISLTLL